MRGGARVRFGCLFRLFPAFFAMQQPRPHGVCLPGVKCHPFIAARAKCTMWLDVAALGLILEKLLALLLTPSDSSGRLGDGDIVSPIRGLSAMRERRFVHDGGGFHLWSRGFGICRGYDGGAPAFGFTGRFLSWCFRQVCVARAVRFGGRDPDVRMVRKVNCSTSERVKEPRAYEFALTLVDVVYAVVEARTRMQMTRELLSLA